MLWEHYLFKRGTEVYDTWDTLFKDRSVKLLYIAGRGFDVRAQMVLKAFVGSLVSHKVEKAELLLVGFGGYQLSEELLKQTEVNALELEDTFKQIGVTTSITIGSKTVDDEEISATNILRLGVESVFSHITDQTDIVIDVSSLPRVVYLALMTGLLYKLIPDKTLPDALFAKGVNLQVLVAEDPSLDGHIRSEDPSHDLILIPGFSGALQTESSMDWPIVWFPILGENRMNQLEKVMSSVLKPDYVEICPVLPHPSKDPRRADRLLVAYKKTLFDKSPIVNILYVNESHPFEVYRQLYSAMRRYRESLVILGGCSLVVTPLSSKLITLGAGLACFEMRPTGMDENYGVAIPYAEPKRYVASIETLLASKPEIASMVLTGISYEKA